MEQLLSPQEQRNKRLQEIDAYISQYDPHYQRGHERDQYTIATSAGQLFWKDLGKHYPGSEGIKLENFIKEKLKDKTLIDLGGGWEINHLDKEKITELGIKKYQVVDKLPFGRQERNEAIMGKVSHLNVPDDMDATHIQDDLLHFVSRLPDNSSNFFMGAIDSYVIPEGKYWEYLAEEITRATENKGIIIAVNSDIGHCLDDDKFKFIYQQRQDRPDDGIIVMEKL